MTAYGSKSRDIYPEIFRIHIPPGQDQVRKLRVSQFRRFSFALDQFDIAQRKRQHTTTHAMADQHDRARRVMCAQNFHDLTRSILAYEHAVLVGKYPKSFSCDGQLKIAALAETSGCRSCANNA